MNPPGDHHSEELVKKVVLATDRTMPATIPPGYAVICDKLGRGPKVIEAFMVCEGSRGCRVLPVEGRIRGEMVPGSLSDKVRAGDLVVAMISKYPEVRDDGRPHVKNGHLIYPSTDGDTAFLFDGVYYHRQLGRDSLDQAKAARAAKEAKEAKKAEPVAAGKG